MEKLMNSVSYDCVNRAEDNKIFKGFHHDREYNGNNDV